MVRLVFGMESVATFRSWQYRTLLRRRWANGDRDANTADDLMVSGSRTARTASLGNLRPFPEIWARYMYIERLYFRFLNIFPLHIRYTLLKGRLCIH